MAGEGPLLEPEAAPRDADSPGAEPVAEMRDRPRPERDVDEWVELEQTLALRLRVAPTDGDQLLGIALLQRSRLGETRGEALIRLLPDRAGVEDEDVGGLLGVALPHSQLLEHALDALRIVRIHLAAEGGDVVALHQLEIVAAARSPFGFPI